MTPAVDVPSAATDGWGREEDPDVAVRRILDAAGAVFAERGVDRSRMNHVADAAGCSRGTLYRYFPDRDALRRAFIAREALRIGGLVAERLAGVTDPRERLVEGVVAAVEEVRADDVLLAWFDPAAAATAGHTARGVETLDALVQAFVDDLVGIDTGGSHLRPGLDRALAADWIVRTVLSLLTYPADGPTEHRLLDSFLVPALFT